MHLAALPAAIALAAIRAYRRWLSPRKGYGCAYRLHTGRASCSALGLRTVRRHGLLGGLRLLRRRTARCAAVPRARVGRAQRGDCDLGCDLPGDGGCVDGRPGGCRLLEFIDCCNGCHGGERRRRDPPRGPRRRDRESPGARSRGPAA